MTPNNQFPYRWHGAILGIMESDPVMMCCQRLDGDILYKITSCGWISYCLMNNCIDCGSSERFYKQNCPVFRVYLVGPNDAIRRRKPLSSLVQVMACYLMAPTHYLNQCWFTPRNKFRENHAQNEIVFIRGNAFRNLVCKMSGICWALNVISLPTS